MAESEIPGEVVEFIAEQITSMEQLEVLLLLSASPQKEWSVDAVFSQIQSSKVSVEHRLREFCDKGLLAQPRDLVFQYAPKTEALAKTVRLLATTYKERRIKIIELIYRKQIDKVQSFADAFKIRKDKPNA